MNKNKIKCPNCSTEINVDDIALKQLKSEIEKEYKQKEIINKEKFTKLQEELSEQKKQLIKDQENINLKIEEELNIKLKEEKTKIETKLKNKLDENNKDIINSLKAEIKEQSSQLKDYNQSQIELEKLKRKTKELEDEYKLKAQKEITKQVEQQANKIKQLAEEENQLKILDKDKQLEQTKIQLKEALKKAEQGSSQLQGEVQELAIEKWLQSEYPLDNIEEIKKGQKGGDCIQIVNTRDSLNCGSIYYESKRTKTFQSTWIEKFKKDIQEKNATFGVIITNTMPTGMDRLGQMNGIWICSFQEFKSLSKVLRESLKTIHSVMESQENKEDKMNLLYNFLTGNEFKLQIQSIVEGFTQMKIDLDKEKLVFQKTWKQREKQIEKVLYNTTNMYGSIKGIAGKSIANIPALEIE